MPADPHGDLPIDPGADHVPDGAPPEVVERPTGDAGGEPCCPAGRRPRLPELVDGVRLPVVEPVEDQRAIETSGGPPVLEDRPEGTPEREPARLPALGRAGGEGEGPRLAVEGRPGELRDLALAHARPV